MRPGDKIYVIADTVNVDSDRDDPVIAGEFGHVLNVSADYVVVRLYADYPEPGRTVVVPREDIADEDAYDTLKIRQSMERNRR